MVGTPDQADDELWLGFFRNVHAMHISSVMEVREVKGQLAVSASLQEKLR